jgi:hypothetical protein
MTSSAIVLPQPDHSEVAVPPPGTDPGTWAGAPSAVHSNGYIYLAYRLRKPIGAGRGYAVEVARSADGISFETILTVPKEDLDTESLERPALVLTPDGTWRLYLSCATTGTKHWRVELLEADGPASFDPRNRQVVLPGDEHVAVKDPVIVHYDGLWHLWASVHPLGDPAHTDRMTTEYATSPDGVEWTWRGTALAPRPGEWDARGVRVAAVKLGPGSVTAWYDGRATAVQNYEERTGVATGSKPDALTAVDSAGVAGSDSDRGLRYLDIVEVGDGHERWYYEYTRADGAHELRTELH